jgi:hypothetical protein
MDDLLERKGSLMNVSDFDKRRLRSTNGPMSHRGESNSVSL